MYTATVTVTVLLSVLLIAAAVRKLSHREHVVKSYTDLGVPEDKLNLLAGILLVGAGGLLVGLVWPPIGVASAAGVICYFLGAVIVHLRAGDAKGLPTPLTYAALAIAALTLRLLTP